MGFYDDGDERPTRKREKKNRVWLSSLFSSFIGALIVVLMVPSLANYGLLPYDVVSKGTVTYTPAAIQQMQSAESFPPVQQSVQINVNSDVIDAVEKVSDAIVGIVNIQSSTDIFNRRTQNVERGTGSGIVFDKIGDKAHIVTNYHVIENAQQVEVSLPNGERVPADLKGYDSLTDLAVLSIDAKYVDLVVNFGDSDTLRAGEPAIAIGNPLGLQFSRTVTMGIISARERTVPVPGGWELNVIQTDAAINPGNSGGALINIQGQVIGINTLKVARTGVEGIGFAIPINEAIPIIHDLVRYGEVQRAYMGVTVNDLTNIASFHWQETLKLPESVRQGVIIEGVESLSPADKAGLRRYDVIVKLDETEIANVTQLRRYIFTQKRINDTVDVTFYRGGLEQTVTLELTRIFQGR
jgi:serine protease Do